MKVQIENDWGYAVVVKDSEEIKIFFCSYKDIATKLASELRCIMLGCDVSVSEYHFNDKSLDLDMRCDDA